MADFRGYVTSAGQQFESLAKQMKYPVTIGFIEIGDGKLPDSESPITRTRLINPLKQFPAIVEQDDKNPGEWVATCYIPADDAINGAGYMIREIGCKLIDQGNGILYAYRRVSDDWKPVDSSGEAKSFIYKLRFIPSNGELLTPTIDPSVVLVSKEELARVMKAHEASRNHPDASEQLKGFTRLASQDETNDSTAASAAAVVTVKTLWGWVIQASESLRGMLKVATQQQVEAGSADDVALTPKKAKHGFSMVATTGAMALRLPSWLGGWLIQGGMGAPSGGFTTITFPISYPAADSYVAMFGHLQSSSPTGLQSTVIDDQTRVAGSFRCRQLYLDSNGIASGANGFFWFTFGKGV
ncbi:phage tail protein [Aeromonas sp. SCS5]|uniref:phage tail protein n=1 Tax=Aeromonas sp. SCS5 TaxID=1519205 RepID=UPI000903F665|nr:phage tail protein [Aeromonas sp. SCS5]